MAKAYLSLGSNLGQRAFTLDLAVRTLDALGSVVAASRPIETVPMYVLDQPAFLNMAVVLETTLAPEPLMQELLNLETALGRKRTLDKGARIIDIDMVYYDNVVMHTPWLALPHPLRLERGFVLEPLAAIAPEFIDPVVGVSLQELWARVNQSADSVRKAA
jgi:2-amino-4-hydroxy-6-hydroxymethyldihydropteridine diphosphokinase